VFSGDEGGGRQRLRLCGGVGVLCAVVGGCLSAAAACSLGIVVT